MSFCRFVLFVFCEDSFESICHLKVVVIVGLTHVDLQYHLGGADCRGIKRLELQLHLKILHFKAKQSAGLKSLDWQQN